MALPLRCPCVALVLPLRHSGSDDTTALSTLPLPIPTKQYRLLLVRSLISIFFTPPAINMLMIAAGLLLIYRMRRTGMLLCVAGLVSLWLLATPIVSTALGRVIEAYPALDISSLPDTSKLAMVVAGSSHFDFADEYGVATPIESGLVRLHYAANLHNRTGLRVLLTGGPTNKAQKIHAEVLAESLSSQFGIEAKWIEKKSATTWQNAAFSAEILQSEGIDTIVLVTQAYHMRRAAMLFELAGFTVIAAPTQLSPNFPWHDWKYWMPTPDALQLSTLVFHETLGLLWYLFVSPVESQFENEVTLGG